MDWLRELGDPVLVLTAGTGGRVARGTALSAAAYGINYEIRFGDGAGSGDVLAPHTAGMLVAASLLDGHPAEAVQVDDAAVVGEQIAALDPTAVLICGGGSARRRDGAPGYLDLRAVPYDDRLAELIGIPDLAALAAPDLLLADALLSDLARPLAVGARLAGGWAHRPRAEVDSYCAPHGVADIIARWWTDA